MDTTTPANATQAGAPWHLWVIGIVALLFTGFGGYDYTMTQLGDRAHVAASVEPMGVSADAALAYFADFPLWLDFLWAIGVWGAVLGAVLLLLRKRLASRAFLTSLIAFIITNTYGFANPMPGMTDPNAVYIVTGVVFLVMLGLLLYARAMTTRGVLR